MRSALAAAMALAFVCSALPAVAQQPAARPNAAAGEDAGKMGARRVTGSIKSATEKGLVVTGHEEGQADREWAFAYDGDTRLDGGEAGRAVKDLRVGEPVTVQYVNRDGKIIAQRVDIRR